MNKLLLFIYFFSSNAFSINIDFERIFSSSPVEGTIVVENLDGSETYVYNDDRAKEKLTIASTFKIANTLIGIEENVVLDKSSVFTWSGKEYGVKAWNHNQTLASAFQVSCVWCYQLLAKKVGVDKYKTYINAMNYGSLPESFDVQRFWLDGTLKVSALEQIAFLKHLYRQELPFRIRSFKVLKEIMLVEKTTDYTLFAKSGWAPNGKKPVGWYIGYIESKKGTWFFATNLAIKEAKNLSLRKNISMEILKRIGVISGS